MQEGSVLRYLLVKILRRLAHLKSLVSDKEWLLEGEDLRVAYRQEFLLKQKEGVQVAEGEGKPHVQHENYDHRP